MDLVQEYVHEGFMRAVLSKDFRTTWREFITQPLPVEWSERSFAAILNELKSAVDAIETNFGRFSGGSLLLKKSRTEMMVMFAAGAKCFEDFYEAYIVAIDVAIKAGVQFAPSPNHEPQEKKELMHIHLHPTFDIKLDNQPTGPVNVHVVSMPGRAAETQVVRDDEGNIISSTQIERDLTSGGSCLKGVAA